ncbi:hypothetical protein RJ639_020125 [Escallonia herrerae]|uniref:RNase H type-1 domain-containing protein n=1 Tax=Escallonia herrerae TaxID=1293975 RepID=A0AA89AKR6_9ASTE|nr:hypothetical protein RJ639_020125 [Escallonia herrerae]
MPITMITFFDKDSKDIKTPHDDPLVITIKAGNFDLKRVLVDNGSSVEILFYDAFKKMNIPTNRLRKMDTPLYGFSNQPVTVEGIIALPVVIGTPLMQANFMLNFVVVKVPSAYNGILGRPALNQLQAVVSPYHLKIKFPIEDGIGELHVDRRTRKHSLSKTSEKGKPVEELVSIKVYPGKENKTVQIGSNLKEDTKLELVNLLRTYADVFAWTVADMPELISRSSPTAQALADFIVECTSPEDPPQLVISEVPDPWNLYVDDSSAIGSSGAGIILISPKGFVVEYAFRFGFQASNNEADYEALLTGIRLAHALKVDFLSVHSDSQLMVNHVLGDYEARDEKRAQYLQLVKTSTLKFKNFTIHQIPRDQNTQADTLSRLASAEGLKKKLDEAKGAWIDELPKVLWAYRTTPHSIIGEMPFLLCYGTEAMFPVEIGVPMIRALHFNEVNNEVGLRANLDLNTKKASLRRFPLPLAISAREKEVNTSINIKTKADTKNLHKAHLEERSQQK